MSYRIYKRVGDSYSYPYTVVRGKEWSDGTVVGVAASLSGARRIVQRDKKNRGGPERVLVEVIE